MRVPRVARELEALALLREPNRARLYEYVERQARGVSRDEAAAAVGVTRALAAFHLDKLTASGLLKTEYRRLSGRTGPGAGRTSKLYRRSRHQFAVSIPRREHELLARLLAESSGSSHGGARSSADVEPAREYGRSLGHRARNRLRGRPTSARLFDCVESVLETLGFEPYRSSGRELLLRNCPFDPLSRAYAPLVCGLSQAIIRGVVEGVDAGLRVNREEHPDRCCGVVSSASTEEGDVASAVQ